MEYKAGDTSALGRAEKALSDLEKSTDSNTYEKDVWLSGAYMRMADILQKDDPRKAKDYLEKAKK